MGFFQPAGATHQVLRRTPYGALQYYVTAQNDMDMIFIKDVAIRAIIGLDCWHRPKPQPVLVAVRFPTSKVADAARTDNVADTIDYSPVYKAILSVAAETDEFRTLSEFAGRLGSRVLPLLKAQGVFEVHVRARLPKAVRQAEGVQIMMDMEAQRETATEKVSGSVRLVEKYAVKGLRVECVIGAGAIERTEKQPVVMDLELRGLPEDSQVGGTWNLADWQDLLGGKLVKVSTGEIVLTATRADNQAKKFENTDYTTIEKFAVEVVRFLIFDIGWDQACISARKTSIFGLADGPGVAVLRTRNSNWG